jgi:nucleoside-diphosphate-sugar epimerase
MDRAALPLTIRNQATNEIPKQYLDCTKARRRLNWEPKWTLDESLAETVGWYRDWQSRSGRGHSDVPRTVVT